MTAMYDPQCECPDCSEERERRALKQKQPTLDLEKLAEETAVACIAVAYSDQDQLRVNIERIILSALHEAVRRMNEKIALKCEIAVGERTLDWLKCRKVLDDEIDRLTAENKQMRATIKEVLPTLDEIAQTEQCVQKVPCASCDTRSIARRLRDTLDKHGEAPPSPVAGQ